MINNTSVCYNGKELKGSSKTKFLAFLDSLEEEEKQEIEKIEKAKEIAKDLKTIYSALVEEFKDEKFVQKLLIETAKK